MQILLFGSFSMLAQLSLRLAQLQLDFSLSAHVTFMGSEILHGLLSAKHIRIFKSCLRVSKLCICLQPKGNKYLSSFVWKYIRKASRYMFFPL